MVDARSRDDGGAVDKTDGLGQQLEIGEALRVAEEALHPDTITLMWAPTPTDLIEQTVLVGETRNDRYGDGDAIDRDAVRDTARQIIERDIDPPARTAIGDPQYWWVGPDRTGIDDVLDDDTLAGIDEVVATSAIVFGRSLGTIADRIETVLDSGADIVLIDEGELVASDDGAGSVAAFLRSLDSVGPDLRRQTSQRDVEDWRGSVEWDGGRPPLGFTVERGELVPEEDIDDVRWVLDCARRGREQGLDAPRALSLREAADRLDTSPRTVKRAIEERPELYGLEKE